MSGAGCGPRGRALQARTRAAPGLRSGGIMTALQGACWTGTGRKPSSQETRPGAEPREPPWAVARAAVERREAGVPIARDAPRLASADTVVAPRGAPPPRVIEGTRKREGAARAPRQAGGGALLSDNREAEAAADDGRLSVVH